MAFDLSPKARRGEAQALREGPHGPPHHVVLEGSLPLFSKLRSFSELLKFLYGEVGVTQNALQNLGMKCFSTMVGNGNTPSFSVLIDLVAPALPSKKEANPLQNPDHLIGC